MKNLIIIIGSVILGCLIFNMMVGDDSGSLKSVTGSIMEQTIEMYG